MINRIKRFVRSLTKLERTGFGLLIFALLFGVAAWIVIYTGAITTYYVLTAISGVGFISGFGILLTKVIRDRMNNKEDDYYSEQIDN